jgi:hypothetical protein
MGDSGMLQALQIPAAGGDAGLVGMPTGIWFTLQGLKVFGKSKMPAVSELPVERNWGSPKLSKRPIDTMHGWPMSAGRIAEPQGTFETPQIGTPSRDRP